MGRGGGREEKEEGKVKLGEWQVAYKYIYKAAGEYIYIINIVMPKAAKLAKNGYQNIMLYN